MKRRTGLIMDGDREDTIRTKSGSCEPGKLNPLIYMFIIWNFLMNNVLKVCLSENYISYTITDRQNTLIFFSKMMS